MSLDKREPAVYVSVEDASFLEPTTETGRTVFGVILCDRGPHNTLQEFTRVSEFHRVHGEPNYKRTSDTHYQLDNALAAGGRILACRVVPDNSTISNCQIKEKSDSEKVQHNYFFESECKTVTATNQEAVDAVNIGEWVYAEHDGSTAAAQVVSKSAEGDETKYLKLAHPYDGATTNDLPQFGDVGANLYKFVPYTVETLPNINRENQLDTNDPEICYTFYATGVGSYYNNLVLRGRRNTSFEKMYMMDGEKQYPYLFLDVSLHLINNDGSETLMEGPWTVSLTPQTSKGDNIRDLDTGEFLFIENVINERSNLIKCKSSDGVRQLMEAADALQRRMQVLSLFSYERIVGSDLVGSGVGINFENGSIGEGQYDSYGNLNPSGELLGKVARAYAGTLGTDESDSDYMDDDSVRQLREYVYPLVQPDYVVTGGFPDYVQNGGREIAALRQDCIHLADSGFNRTPEDDINARMIQYPWNDWTSAIYTQYREIFDTYTGTRIFVSPVYHAIRRHLEVDRDYFIAEPVANIQKGAIAEQAKLAYNANHERRGDLMDEELNFTIREPDGQYFLTQMTTWKQMSVLKQLHVAKFIAYLQRNIPPLLKDILERRATNYWIQQARTRVHSFMGDYVDDGGNDRFAILRSYDLNVGFDNRRSELNVYLGMIPIRSIQRINVYITVQ